MRGNNSNNNNNEINSIKLTAQPLQHAIIDA